MYIKTGKIVAMLILFSPPASPARGFSIRILLFGLKEINHPLNALLPSTTTPLVDWLIYILDSSTKNTFSST